MNGESHANTWGGRFPGRRNNKGKGFKGMNNLDMLEKLKEDQCARDVGKVV